MRVVLISWSPDPNEAVTHLRSLAEQVDVAAPKGPGVRTGRGIATQLRTAIERPPEDPVVPDA